MKCNPFVPCRSSFAPAAVFVTLIFVGFPAMAGSPNLIQNPSFEQVPCGCVGQGIMPDGWDTLAVTPDTYSDDGSYGLPPDVLGNFTGATAQDGIRWVAAWSYAGEIFGQRLASPLEPGKEYRLSAYLREAVRADLANPGTYRIELWDSGGDAIVLGSFQPPIANQAAWELRTLTFTAPSGAATHTTLAFRPIAEVSAYPGIDNVLLEVSATTIAIDIKPGGFPDTVNVKAQGNIPVAILTTNASNNIATFDASMVDPETVRFGRTLAKPVRTSLEDVDGDSDADLVLQFKTKETGIVCGDTTATLTGRTFGGESFTASGSFVTVGCPGK